MDGGTILALAGLVVGVLAIVVSVVLYFRSKSHPRLVAVVEESTIVDVVADPSVRITFDGAHVDRVTRSTIALRNRGRGPFVKQQSAPKDPVAFHLPTDTQILRLSCDELAVERGVQDRATSTRPIDATHDITPDFLNPGDVVVLEVLHTAEIDCLIVRGTVIGGDEVATVRSPTAEIGLEVAGFRFTWGNGRFGADAANAAVRVAGVGVAALIASAIASLFGG